MEKILATDLVGYRLARYGFVHVTGLSMEIVNHRDGSLTTKCLLADPSDCGHYSVHCDTLFVVTTNGEIWIHQIVDKDPITGNMYYLQMEPALCPLDEGTPVIAEPWRINYLSTFEVLSRLADPTWNRGNGDFPLVRTTAWRPTDI